MISREFARARKRYRRRPTWWLRHRHNQLVALSQVLAAAGAPGPTMAQIDDRAALREVLVDRMVGPSRRRWRR